jgi:hypothetical protein
MRNLRDYLLSRQVGIVGDPSRGGFKGIRPVPRKAGVFVLFKALTQASMIRSFHKTKIPQQLLRDRSDAFGGERGIRTPGPAIAGQRFSRPPHSTTLPFLLSSTEAFLTNEALAELVAKADSPQI